MSGFGAAPVAAGTAPMVAGGSGSAVAAGDANHTVPSAAPVPLPRKHTGPPPPYIKVPVEDGGESVPAIPLVRALKRARVADGVVYTTDDVGAVPAGNPARHVVTKLRRHDAFLRYVHPPIVVSDACVGRWCVGSCVGHVTGALFRCRYQRNAELLAAVLDPTTTTGTTDAQAGQGLTSAVRVAVAHLEGCTADQVGASEEELAEQGVSVMARLQAAIQAERQGIVEDTQAHQQALQQLVKSTSEYVGHSWQVVVAGISDVTNDLVLACVRQARTRASHARLIRNENHVVLPCYTTSQLPIYLVYGVSTRPISTYTLFSRVQ